MSDRMPSKGQIKTFHEGYLLKSGKFFSHDDLWSDDHCFACGFDGPTERAHILARCEGGTNAVSNLHLLCYACHKQSEFISGAKYYLWFERQTLMSRLLTETAFSDTGYLMQHVAAIMMGAL